MDMDTTEISEHTRELVFERNGIENCWLCGTASNASTIQISHQIDAAAIHSFSQFQANGTIPASVTSPSHVDNLFPLCPNCHAGYNLTFPDWVMIPDTETLSKYIDYEKSDYKERSLISQKSHSIIPPRSLPLLNRNKIFYHPLIITEKFSENYVRWSKHGNTLTHWPKHWLGEPTTTIHRAARRGLFESTPIQAMSLGKHGKPEWQTGVPVIFQKLVGELIRLWARQPPKRR